VKVLAISTSQSQAGVVWSEGDEFRWKEFSPLNTGEVLHEFTQPMLANGVDLFAVDVGPGSYTGTRVGVAFVQGMARARSLPWVGISAWQILAKLAQPGQTSVNASRSGEVLVQQSDETVIALPLRDVAGIPFGFPCANPTKYGGIEGNEYIVPDFRAYLWTLVTIAKMGKSIPSLPVYFDRFTTDAAKKL